MSGKNGRMTSCSQSAEGTVKEPRMVHEMRKRNVGNTSRRKFYCGHKIFTPTSSSCQQNNYFQSRGPTTPTESQAFLFGPGRDPWSIWDPTAWSTGENKAHIHHVHGAVPQNSFPANSFYFNPSVPPPGCMVMAVEAGPSTQYAQNWTMQQQVVQDCTYPQQMYSGQPGCYSVGYQQQEAVAAVQPVSYNYQQHQPYAMSNYQAVNQQCYPAQQYQMLPCPTTAQAQTLQLQCVNLPPYSSMDGAVPPQQFPLQTPGLPPNSIVPFVQYTNSLPSQPGSCLQSSFQQLCLQSPGPSTNMAPAAQQTNSLVQATPQPASSCSSPSSVEDSENKVSKDLESADSGVSTVSSDSSGIESGEDCADAPPKTTVVKSGSDDEARTQLTPEEANLNPGSNGRSAEDNSNPSENTEEKGSTEPCLIPAMKVETASENSSMKNKDSTDSSEPPQPATVKPTSDTNRPKKSDPEIVFLPGVANITPATNVPPVPYYECPPAQYNQEWTYPGYPNSCYLIDPCGGAPESFDLSTQYLYDPSQLYGQNQYNQNVQYYTQNELYIPPAYQQGVHTNVNAYNFF